jgi:hypothetical protein
MWPAEALQSCSICLIRVHSKVMSRSMPAEEQISRSLHSCPTLCTQIGLKGLACLSTCNKALSNDVTNVLCGDSTGYLDSSLETARSTEQQQHYQAVAWLASLLLRQAPATAADVTERLLILPDVDLECAAQLVAAGMRITFAQLLAVANSWWQVWRCGCMHSRC